MSNNSIDCYVLPTAPLPLLLPIECIAEVVENPAMEPLEKALANWMKGYATWKTQRVPVLSYSALHDSSLDESRKLNPCLVVMNPIPDAVRKAYFGFLCFGEVKQLQVNSNSQFAETSEKVDRRYVAGVVEMGDQKYLIPKLSSLGVALSYF